MNTLDSPQGQFTLNRYPTTKDNQLRAWDAADEYLLHHLDEQQILSDSTRVLILNDSFGCLSVALASHKPSSISDSYVAQQAIMENLKANDIKSQDITLKNSLQPVDNEYDLIIIKVPKNLAMLEDQLFRIRDCCHENTLIIASAMVKHIHTSTLKIFERVLGATTTSLARKKARLVLTQFDATLKPGKSPYPSQYTLDKTKDNYFNHANVFSREKLDLGSRLMLKHIPVSDRYTKILDLACGNGVLGITAARRNPKAHITFVDESYMAVESAKLNTQNLLDQSTRADFKVTDCLAGIDGNSLDLILNNPPFHQNHVVGDFIALQMFKESYERLKTEGEIFVVGNRHLAYHIKLKSIFGNCEMVASNKKYVILKSVKH